ncbi:MAG: putative toxin-antitoxin system toxin component, PIN family [Rhodanobacter sp.]
MTDDEDAVPRIVLDTNVCLDLLVFRDPACMPLRDALQRGAVRAVTRPDCRDEWRRVLHYPGLPVDDDARPALMAAFDALSHMASPQQARPVGSPLPRCADPDDQKFLELASETGARWLLSKDKALLKLANRTLRVCRFAILQPQAWSLAELPFHAPPHVS